MQRFVVACAQMESRPLAIQENLEKALALAARAVSETGAKLVVLPETVTTGFVPGCGARELWQKVDPLPGPLSEAVGKTVRQLGIYLALPTYERGPEEGVVFNSVALIGPEGAVLGVYRKIHLFPSERLGSGGWSSPGERPVVVPTALGGIGLSICYDGDFPELFRCEALAGAELILRPSAFLRDFEIWKLTNCARAFDNQVFIAACNAVGSAGTGQGYFGHSMVVGPAAEVLALGKCQEQIVAAEVASRSLPATDHLRDRNPHAYLGLLESSRVPAAEPAR